MPDTPQEKQLADEKAIEEIAARYEKEDDEAAAAAKTAKAAKPDPKEGKKGDEDRGDDAKGKSAKQPAAGTDDDDDDEDLDEDDESGAGADDKDSDESDVSGSGKGKPAKKSAGKEGNDGKEDVDDDEDEDSEASEFEASLRAAASLEDLPEEARPLVEKRLKDMERHFTRNMQEQTGWKKERTQLRQQEVLRSTNPVAYVAQILSTDPELEEKVAKELERRAALSTDERKAEDSRLAKNAEKAVRDEDAAIEAVEKRSGEVEALASKLCKQSTVPFGKAIQAMIANAILASDDGDISDKEVAAIVKEYANEHKRSTIASKREDRKRYLKDKDDDAKESRIRPGAGKAIPPGTPDKPKSLLENMEASVNEMFPGAD